MTIDTQQCVHRLQSTHAGMETSGGLMDFVKKTVQQIHHAVMVGKGDANAGIGDALDRLTEKRRREKKDDHEQYDNDDREMSKLARIGKKRKLSGNEQRRMHEMQQRMDKYKRKYGFDSTSERAPDHQDDETGLGDVTDEDIAGLHEDADQESDAAKRRAQHAQADELDRQRKKHQAQRSESEPDDDSEDDHRDYNNPQPREPEGQHGETHRRAQQDARDKKESVQPGASAPAPSQPTKRARPGSSGLRAARPGDARVDDNDPRGAQEKTARSDIEVHGTINGRNMTTTIHKGQAYHLKDDEGRTQLVLPGLFGKFYLSDADKGRL